MEEIAQAAGVGVGTLYRHFPDKTALLDAVGARTLHAFADVTAALVDEPAASGDVVALLHRYLERAAADATLRFALSAASRDAGSLVHDAMRAHREDLEKLIARDITRGLVRPGFDVDAFRALCAAVVLTMDAPLPTDSWRTVAAILEDGLCPPVARLRCGTRAS